MNDAFHKVIYTFFLVSFGQKAPLQNILDTHLYILGTFNFRILNSYTKKLYTVCEG